MDANVLTNFRKTCRTCVRVYESRKELISIFDVDQTFLSKKIKFSEMLAAILKHQAYEDDPLPKKVCVICLQQIRSAFFFKEQAENSFMVLSKKLGIARKTFASKIKAESNESKPMRTDNQLPVIMASRTIEPSYSEEMLVEVEPPQMQEQFDVTTEREQSDNGDIDGDSDHDFSEGEPIVCIEESQSSHETGTSPDSGINDESEKQMNFRNANFLAMQIAESAGLPQLQCNICLKQMISFQALNRHKRNYHSDSKCVYCKRKFGNRFQLKMHVRFKHPQKFNEFRLNGQVNAVVHVEPIDVIPECSSCDAKFADRDALVKHHAECDLQCIECSVTSESKEEYLKHVKQAHNIKLDKKKLSLECPFGCTFNFQSEKHLLNHVQKSHPDDKDSESVADTVSEASVSTEASSGIIRMNKARLMFNSKIQNARITTRRNSIGFPIHSAKKEVKSLLKMNWLKKKFSFANPEAAASVTNAQLTKNVKRYTKQEFRNKFIVTKDRETLYCQPCRKEIGFRSLAVHLKSKHAAMKCYLCEICPEGFFRQDYRHRHMGYVHGQHYNCTKCKVQFDRAYKYDAHMETHGVKAKHFKPNDNEDKYDLPTTNMMYIEDITTYDYSTGTKPMRRMSVASTSMSTPTPMGTPLSKDEFVRKHVLDISSTFAHCTICDHRISKNSMVSHLTWKHALTKPLKCAFCSERVIKNNARLLHMARSHPNEYKCKDCNIQFARHIDWSNHSMQLHQRRLLVKPSSEEEEDISTSNLRFVAIKNEEESTTEGFGEDLDYSGANEDSDLFIQPNNEPNSHVCIYCGKGFASPKNLQLHKSHKHRTEMALSVTKNYQEGSSDSMTIDEFRKKFTNEPNDQDITCTICSQTLRKRNFGAHLKARHATTGAFKCAVCPENFYRPEQRMQHMSQSHRGKFFCSTCGIQFYRNSRYAKHMSDMHSIELDAFDECEVDLNLDELLYVDYIRKTEELEAPQMTQQDSPMPTNNEQTAFSDSVTREVFISRYIRNAGKDSKRCSPCNKIMKKDSIYHHLIGFHAVKLPFKCPFCQYRFERGAHRSRHLSIYHPNDYKCNECGVQFAKHAHYLEHMLVEHNIHVKSPKSSEEENDLNMLELMFHEHRRTNGSQWMDDDNSSFSEKEVPSQSKDEVFLKPQIKDEPNESSSHLMIHSIFGDERSLVDEINSYKEEYSYNDFKAQFIAEADSATLHCHPCDMLVPKTSLAAHLRLWHASKSCFTCELCAEGFKRQDYRQRHIKAAHPKDYNCSECDIQYHRAALFKEHMKEIHKKILILPEPMTKDEVDVPLEKLKFVQKLDIDPETVRKGGRKPKITTPEAEGLTFKEFQDLYVEFNGERYNCKVCDFKMTKFNIKKHVKRCHSTCKPYYCELCPEGFKKTDERTKHMADEHPDDFKCLECKVQFYTSYNYADHMMFYHHKQEVRVVNLKSRTDIDVPMERLRFSAEIFERETQLEGTPSRKNFDHIPDSSEMTRQQFFGKFYRSIKGREIPLTKCLACTKVFSTKNRHFHAVYNHATTKPYKCEICHNKFTVVNKRIAHMRVHHPNDYKCSVCNAQFDRAHRYGDHMRSHHDMEVDVPVFDMDEFNTPSDNVRYVKNVTSVRKLKALGRYSMKSYNADLETSNLSFENGPQKCTECDEEFETARAMRTHLRHHLNGFPVGLQIPKEAIPTEQPKHLYDCDLCDKKFKTIHALNAHKQFSKHINEESGVGRPKRVKIEKKSKVKYMVHCDVCDFKSSRRDYIEHHVKAAHKPEFHCAHCQRILSSYNLFLFHMHLNHPRAKTICQKKHVCEVCGKGFRSNEILEEHKTCKHAPDAQLPEHFCIDCYVDYFTPAALDVHYQNIYHQKLKQFMERNEGGEIAKLEVKEEPMDDAPLVETHEAENSSCMTEEFENMETDGNQTEEIDEQSIDSVSDTRAKRSTRNTSVEPPTKRLKTSEPALTVNNARVGIDKLDYLNFLKTCELGYKCGICGIEKNTRKYLLRHLKEHKEIPTFKCTHCPEKFVFKKKFDEHLLTHEHEDAPSFVREELDVEEEHPRFQKIEKNEIKCQICEMSFKLTIMLNRHNSHWHSEDNSLKNLPMNQQKEKKDEPRSEISVIKLQKCKQCDEAFIKPGELEEHLKQKHSESDDQMDENESTTEGSFACDKCKYVFKEDKFLENHKKFFCINRQGSKSEQLIIEQ